MALLAVANAVVTVSLAYVNKSLTAIGGPIATSTIVGIYMIYGILAVYIIRKPGTAFITYMIGACVQSIMGIGYGIPSAFAAAICYWIAVELVFALFRYRNWGYTVLAIASVAATVVWFPVAAYMFGYLKWDTSVLVITLLVRVASGIVLCGWLSKWLGDRLAAANLLKHFAIGQASVMRS